VDIFRFLYPFCRPHLKSYIVGLLLVPFSIAATLGIAYLTGEATRLIAQPAQSGNTFTDILWGILALAVVRSLTLFGMRYLIINASREMEFALRNHVFRHLLTQDQLFFKSQRTGDLLTRITSDVERSRLIAGPVIMYTASTVFMLVFALPLMASISWLLTILLMVPLSLLSVAVRYIGPQVHERVSRAQAALSDLSSRAQENFAGVRVVKAFGQEDYEHKSFSQIARAYFSESVSAAKIQSWMQPIVAGVGDLAVLAILLAGGHLILQGDLRFPEFVKFFGYQMLLIWPMIAIGWVINQFQRGRASVERIQELLAVEPSVIDTSVPLDSGGDATQAAIQGSISIRGLTFSFGASPVLKNVSLEVPQGKTVAIVGRTGSGKSTLVNLLSRVYPVPRGRILVDGTDVNDLPLGLLRRAVGFVPQETFLFSQTLEENIAFGTDESTPTSIQAVAALTRLDKDIDQFPHGYQEFVGERGVTLSGGQKQRAAISRALLVQPRILVLDDALSAVDTHTEEEILQQLRLFTKELTTVVVSHRISSIKHADRIYVLDEGRVVEEGTHDDLLQHGGIYADIHRRQLIADELDRF
jgi:ATP-binding cassette subfamily B multidrug efflux pump